MNSNIQTVYDSKRGCGWRKEKGLYLRSDDAGMPCGKLPIELTVCPCCGQGWKPSRGWTWIDGDKLVAISGECSVDYNSHCVFCPLGGTLHIGRAGLLWIGERHYKSPAAFDKESNVQGISRRIAHIPREFEVGKTWVFLAHRNCIPNPFEFGNEQTFRAGIFRMFKPDRIEVVCSGEESDEVIEDYLKRGLTPVKVERV